MKRPMLVCGLLAAMAAHARADADADAFQNSMPADAYGQLILSSIEADAYSTLLAQSCGRIDLDASVDIALTFMDRASRMSPNNKSLVDHAFERGQSAAQAKLDKDKPAACAGMTSNNVARALSLAHHERLVLDENTGQPFPRTPARRRVRQPARQGTTPNPFGTPPDEVSPGFSRATE